MEATRCRYCQSRIGGIDPSGWYRNHPERKLAGVTAAVAHGLGVALAFVRIAFIVLTLAFLHFLGPALYVALWLVIPFAPGDDSLLDRGIARVRALVASWQGSARPPSARPNGPIRDAYGMPDVPGAPRG